MSEEDKSSLVENGDVVIGSDSSSEVDIGALNNVGEATNGALISRNIENAITRKVISNVNLERIESIENCRSYLVDFSDSDLTVVPSWLKSLKNFIVSDTYGEVYDDIAKKNDERSRTNKTELRADAALYFKTSGGMTLVGYVDQLQMYRLIRDFIGVSFGNKVKVYVGNGEKAEFIAWKDSNISGARLNL